MSNVEVIELSLIIDDNNTVSFKLDLNQADESAINSICEEIQEKYALSDKAKFRLNQHINNEVAKIKAKINSSKSPMFRSNDNIHNNHNIIDRLYYQGTKEKIEKEKKNKMLQQRKIEEEMKNFSFTPKINSKSKVLSQRDKTISIGEKLYNQRKKAFGYSKIKKSNFSLSDEKDFLSIDETNVQSSVNQSKPVRKYKTSSSLSIANLNKNNNKVYKSASQKWFDRLYQDNKEYSKKKETLKNTYYKKSCPFEPKISNGSAKMMKKRNESPFQFYNRLSSTKSLNLCKSSNNPIPKNKILSPRRQASSYITEPRGETPYYLEKKNIKEIKTEQNLLKSYQEIQTEREKSVKFYQKSINNNLEKFKLKQIKDIFEILIKENDKIDFDSLSNYNIPKHIIDKVVKPTCYMINDRNLEFNFQNFYLIANELLTNYFI